MADLIWGADAASLMPPRLQLITEVASSTVTRAAWQKITIPRPCIMKPAAGAHLLRYTCEPPTDTAISNGLFYTANEGVCYFIVPGIHDWYVNAPTDGTPGTVKFVLLDAMSAVIAPAIGQAASLAAPAVQAPATVSCASGASTSILAYDSARSRYVISNTHASANLYLAFSQAAVNLSGVLVGPGGAFVCEPADNFADLEVRGWADGAAIDAAVQVWR